MTPTEFFREWPIQQIILPSGDRIARTYCWDGTEPSRTAVEANHNIFRLNAQGEVIWQIQRDERGAFNLEAGLKYAREHGVEKFVSDREPFIQLSLKYADGRTNMSHQTGTYPALDTWQLGCTVHATSISGHGYVVDIERGIAVNFLGKKSRPW